MTGLTKGEIYVIGTEEDFIIYLYLNREYMRDVVTK